MRDIYFDIYFV